MRREWSWPRWTLTYLIVSVVISAFFGLALDCADAATCTKGRLLTGVYVGASLLALYVLILIERYIRSGRSGS